MLRFIFWQLLVLQCFNCYVVLAQTPVEIPHKNAPASSKVEGGAYIAFEEKNYKFPAMRQGEKLSYQFHFTNTGNKPLYIYQVQTSCGCTATQWTKEAIAPNQSGEIEVIFDTQDKLGWQNKVILVISNAQNQEEKLTLTGEVVK